MNGRTRPHARFNDPLKLVPRVLRKLHSEWLRLTYPFAGFGAKVSIHPSCSIHRRNAHRIKLGSHLRMERDSSLGISRSGEEEGEPIIVIEDNCVIHWRSQIGARNLIHIERDVLIAQDVLIVDQNHAYEDISTPIADQGFTDGGRIRIGQGSFIAHGAAIICSQGELVLGRNCVVAAHSVVTRSAPPYSVLYGNPARIIRQFDPSQQKWVHGQARSSESDLLRELSWPATGDLAGRPAQVVTQDSN